MTRGSGRRSGAGRDAPAAEWERGSGAKRAAAAGLGAAGAGAGAQRTAEPALRSHPAPINSAGTIPRTRQGKPRGPWPRAPNLQVGRAGPQCLALGRGGGGAVSERCSWEGTDGVLGSAAPRPLLARLRLDLLARRSRPLLQPPRLQFAAPRSLLKRAVCHPRPQVQRNYPQIGHSGQHPSSGAGTMAGSAVCSS